MTFLTPNQQLQSTEGNDEYQVTEKRIVQFRQKKSNAEPWTSCCRMVWNGGNMPSSNVEMAAGFSLQVVLTTMQIDSNRK